MAVSVDNAFSKLKMVWCSFIIYDGCCAYGLRSLVTLTVCTNYASAHFAPSNRWQ